MKIISILIILTSVATGSFWLWNNNVTIRNFIAEYIENGEFLTLEARFTPEQIMKSHRNELLASEKHAFQDPQLKFHPYVFMEVKYTLPDKKTREGVILWSMVDGEMVLNTDNWEVTHGFEDCLRTGATYNDFKILNAIAKNNGVLTKDQIQRELHLEYENFSPWIESCKQKHLIIQRGDAFQLHLQNPKLYVLPQTKISQRLVSKPYNHAQRLTTHYSQSQIEQIAHAAFGHDFTIRTASILYLPVYSIEVLNPDGSLLTSYWNALNGEQIQPKYLSLTP